MSNLAQLGLQIRRTNAHYDPSFHISPKPGPQVIIGEWLFYEMILLIAKICEFLIISPTKYFHYFVWNSGWHTQFRDSLNRKQDERLIVLNSACSYSPLTVGADTAGSCVRSLMWSVGMVVTRLIRVITQIFVTMQSAEFNCTWKTL